MNLDVALSKTRHVKVFPTMGTMATITISPYVDDERADNAAQMCEASLVRDDHRFSHYDNRSDIACWLRGEPIGDDARRDIDDVMDKCLLLQIASNGVFSPFDPETGRLDTAGYAKGHAIAKAVSTVRSAGVNNFSINVGGDVYCSGRPADGRAWRIGVADPSRRRGTAAVLEVIDGGVATSGTAERGAHIWHRRRSFAPTSSCLMSFTVIGPDIATADAYSTIGFAMGEPGIDWVAEHKGYSSLAIRDNGLVTGDAAGLLTG